MLSLVCPESSSAVPPSAFQAGWPQHLPCSPHERRVTKQCYSEWILRDKHSLGTGEQIMPETCLFFKEKLQLSHLCLQLSGLLALFLQQALCNVRTPC